ncbi:type VI secretion system baseplate subunit TssG [Candidatus Uabimicrobium amorphum]|uniref:Uncharacterized protein n=1 Tax=Uabimicrobium amorphum TaxID=2596890 RepID=A0A5S9ISL4_UABAM|nr:type VI secretion system baseplate subunit TssG [Candidatus Uabimicrobium amorphum]BBM86662.1 hypothetical protein UABAM_05048 [Candidatus Uabimicrobium amorphum]
MPFEHLDKVERKVKRTVKCFDIIALLKFLHYRGFHDEQIMFISNKDLQSNATVVEKIDFYKKLLFFSSGDTDYLNQGTICPSLHQSFFKEGVFLSKDVEVKQVEKNNSWLIQDKEVYSILHKKRQLSVYRQQRVVVTVNFGLLGATGLLPSYFSQLMETDEINSEKFTAFINVLEHHLIHSYLRSIYPEYNSKLLSNITKKFEHNEIFPVFRDWEHIKYFVFNMLPLASVTMLHCLFKAVFPELGVRVQRRQQVHSFPVDDFRLGKSLLNELHFLGREGAAETTSFCICLVAEQKETNTGILWTQEIQKRLQEDIFYILEGLTLHLTVKLILPIPQHKWLKLEAKSYLGIDALYDEESKNASKATAITLYHGFVSIHSQNQFFEQLLE